MELTGKCKKDFEKWYYDLYEKNNCPYWLLLVDFYDTLNSMQYGVYVDFFDSVEMYVDVDFYSSSGFEFTIQVKDDSEWYDGVTKPTRHEAQTEAINKANKIYNKQ